MHFNLKIRCFIFYNTCKACSYRWNNIALNNSKQIRNCKQYTINTIFLLMQWLKLYIFKTILSIVLNKVSSVIITRYAITKKILMFPSIANVFMNCYPMDERAVFVEHCHWEFARACTRVVFIYVVRWFLNHCILTFNLQNTTKESLCIYDSTPLP